jgi:hypothetical protein
MIKFISTKKHGSFDIYIRNRVTNNSLKIHLSAWDEARPLRNLPGFIPVERIGLHIAYIGNFHFSQSGGIKFGR